MALLWAKGLKTVLLLVLPEQLDRIARWFRKWISYFLFFKGVEEANQHIAVFKGFCFKIQRHCG